MLELRAEPHLDDRSRRNTPLGRGHDVETELPHLLGRQAELEHRLTVDVGDTRPGEQDLRPLCAGLRCQHDLAGARVELGVRRRRQIPRRLRVPQREVALLDRQDVGEVRLEDDAETEVDRLHALVPDEQRVRHPGRADEPAPVDGHDVLTEARRHVVPEEERRREVLDAAGREKERPLPVDDELEARQVTRVLREQAPGAVADVAPLVADAERRAFEDRQHEGDRAPSRGPRPRRARPTPVDQTVRSGGGSGCGEGTGSGDGAGSGMSGVGGGCGSSGFMQRW